MNVCVAVGDSVWASRRLWLLHWRCVSSREFYFYSADSSSADLETTSADRRLWSFTLRHLIACKVPRQCLYEERSLATKGVSGCRFSRVDNEQVSVWIMCFHLHEGGCHLAAVYLSLAVGLLERLWINFHCEILRKVGIETKNSWLDFGIVWKSRISWNLWKTLY